MGNDKIASRVAVIGGAGVIGSAIAAAIAASGRQTEILDLRPADPLPNGASCRPFDITQDVGWPKDWTEYGAVIIAAGLLAKRCSECAREAWAVNVAGTLRLLDALAGAARPPRVIFLSSGMVYDDERAQPPFMESDCIAGRSLYTSSKICIEAAIRAAALANLVSALVLRPFTVYGHGPLDGDRGHLFGNWLALGRAGRPLVIHGDGLQTIDPVSVDVVAQACLAFLERPADAPHTVVNVTSGSEMSLLRLAELFVECGIAPGYELRPVATQPPRRRCGHPGALQSLLGRTLPRDAETEVRTFLESLACTRVRGKP